MGKKRKSKKQKKRDKYLITGIILVLLAMVMVSSPQSRAFIKKLLYRSTHEQVEFNQSKEQISDFEVFGLDVSQYQHVIVWDNLKAENVDFVFVRASAGVDYRDKYFTYNWREANDHQIIRGAYHYYRPDENSLGQAENFIRQVELLPGDLPPVLDIEDYSDVQSLNSLKSGLLKWLRRVEEHYGVKPVIYTYFKYYESHFADDVRFRSYDFWLARYGHKRQFLQPGDNWLFWQYTKHGQLNGIDGDVDLNVFAGSIDDLNSVCID